MLWTIVQVILLVIVSSSCTEANLATQAKTAAAAAAASDNLQLASGDVLFLQDHHGLVLVPEANSSRERFKRSVADDQSSQEVKYKRLSHSVHVQSDIRYR